MNCDDVNTTKLNVNLYHENNINKTVFSMKSGEEYRGNVCACSSTEEYGGSVCAY